jgi:hypothetical protein
MGYTHMSICLSLLIYFLFLFYLNFFISYMPKYCSAFPLESFHACVTIGFHSTPYHLPKIPIIWCIDFRTQGLLVFRKKPQKNNYHPNTIFFISILIFLNHPNIISTIFFFQYLEFWEKWKRIQNKTKKSHTQMLLL